MFHGIIIKSGIIGAGIVNFKTKRENINFQERLLITGMGFFSGCVITTSLPLTVSLYLYRKYTKMIK